MRSLLLLLFVVTACAQPPMSANEPPPMQPATTTTETSGEVTITGKLTSEGVECRALRADGTNELYTLVGKTGGFQSGDRVKVVGKIAEISHCMQGTTIAVKSMTRL
jgi:hypothetical protein